MLKQEARLFIEKDGENYRLTQTFTNDRTIEIVNAPGFTRVLKSLFDLRQESTTIFGHTMAVRRRF